MSTDQKEKIRIQKLDRKYNSISRTYANIRIKYLRSGVETKIKSRDVQTLTDCLTGLDNIISQPNINPCYPQDLKALITVFLEKKKNQYAINNPN